MFINGAPSSPNLSYEKFEQMAGASVQAKSKVCVVNVLNSLPQFGDDDIVIAADMSTVRW